MHGTVHAQKMFKLRALVIAVLLALAGLALSASVVNREPAFKGADMNMTRSQGRHLLFGPNDCCKDMPKPPSDGGFCCGCASCAPNQCCGPTGCYRLLSHVDSGQHNSFFHPAMVITRSIFAWLVATSARAVAVLYSVCRANEMLQLVQG